MGRRASCDRSPADESDGVYAALWNRQRQVDEAKATLQRATQEEGESVRVSLTQ